MMSYNPRYYDDFGNLRTQALTKKELALLYFPDTSDPHVAVNHLMAWVKQARGLYDDLLQAGYRPSQKMLTPRQVQLICHYLGDP